MKDIKSLRDAASSSGRASDIAAYTEAINELLESNPLGYLTGLEYIISSSVGASTLPKFVESHGLPLAAYEEVMACLEKCIERGEAFSKDVGPQKKAKEYMESFRSRYPNCFMMFEYFCGDESFTESNRSKYIKTYYGKTENGTENRKLLKGMYKTFGEAAIPDLIITASSLSNKAVDTTYTFLKESVMTDPKLNQWLLETSHDVIPDGNEAPYISDIMEHSIQHIVDECRSRNKCVFREAAIMGNDNAQFSYTVEEMAAIQDLISFKEYQMLYLEGDQRTKCYQEIMSLYEEYDGIIPSSLSCYSESMNPRKQTIKEITGRLEKLAKQVARVVDYEIKDVHGYDVTVVYGDKHGAYRRGNKHLAKYIEENIKDISDFADEWMENIFMFVLFTVSTKADRIDDAAEYLRNKVADAIKPLESQDKVKMLYKFRGNGYNAGYVDVRYCCPLAVGKTYAVGDSDIGMFESSQELFEDVADSLIPMMTPNAKIDESTWQMSSMNKKTGSMPRWISQNHDLSYGEEPTGGSTDGDEDDIESYRRPSARKKSEEDEAQAEVNDEKDEEDKVTPPASSGGSATNNYYYYSWNHSNNQNTNSYNQHHQDDHSTGKRVNSDNIGTSSVDDDDDDLEESGNNIPRTFSIYGVEFELPVISQSKYHHAKGSPTEKEIQKADKRMLKMLHSKRSIASIEKTIMSDERAVGSDNTDASREVRIKKYLSSARITNYRCTPKGNAIFKVDIPHIKGIVCAYEEHEMWISSNGKVSSYDEIEFYEDTNPGQITAAGVNYGGISEGVALLVASFIENSYQNAIMANVSLFSESADPKFKVAYKAAYNFENGHALKITYSLDNIIVTNVGNLKPLRDEALSIISRYASAATDGKPHSALRSMGEIFKGAIMAKHNIAQRKKFITELLNQHIQDIGYVDFQAKNCKIIEIYDRADKVALTDPVKIVGVYAAADFNRDKSLVLDQYAFDRMQARVNRRNSNFKVVTAKVGDIQQVPTFMTTHWDQHADRGLVDANGRLISDDDMDRDNSSDIQSAKELHGFDLGDANATLTDSLADFIIPVKNITFAKGRDQITKIERDKASAQIDRSIQLIKNIDAAVSTIFEPDDQVRLKEMSAKLKLDTDVAQTAFTGGDWKSVYDNTIGTVAMEDEFKNIIREFISKYPEIPEKIHPRYLPIEDTSEGMTEGFLDNFKNVAKKAVNKFRGMIGAKKSLANLQMFDKKAVACQKVPLTLPGTNIPLTQIKGSTGSTNTIRESSDLQELFEAGYYISEDVSEDGTFAGMSKNDIKNVVNKLRNKFNAEIMFIHNSSPLIAEMGPASVMRTDRATLNRIQRGSNIDYMPPNQIDSQGKQLETVIIVNPSVLRDFGVRNPSEVEIVISHEYGHVLTFDQLTPADWVDYGIRRQMLSGFAAATAYLEGISDEQAYAEINFLYHQLKPEKIANEAAHIDPLNIINILCRRKPTGVTKNIDLKYILTWKIPEIVLQMNQKTSAGVTSFSNEEICDNLRSTMELYKKVIHDKSYLDQMLGLLNQSLEFYKESVVITEAANNVSSIVSLVSPIIIGGGSSISHIISKPFTDAKTKKSISDIIGKSVSSIDPTLKAARTIFVDFIKKNKHNITSQFLGYSEKGNGFNNKPTPFFTFGSKTKFRSETEIDKGDFIVTAKPFVFAVVSSNSVKGIAERFKKLSTDTVKVAVAIADDSYIQNNSFISLNEDIPSGKKVIVVYLIMSAKRYLEDNCKVIKESCDTYSIFDDILMSEAVGDADMDKPKSDHPVQDTLMDIDKSLTKHQQNAKKTIQNVQNTGRLFMKPVKRAEMWIGNMISKWKDADENKIKERMADPHSRNALMSALKASIKYGALAKAGLLLNPIFLGIEVLRVGTKRSREFRIRNEMIGELKTELQIIDQKIEDAKSRAHESEADRKAVYQLMRFRNELNKKLLRVGGTKEFKKII